MSTTHYTLSPIGYLHSPLTNLADAPRQGNEGAPDAWLEIIDTLAPALQGIQVGHKLILITWLHQANRDTLQVHPRNDTTIPLTGVFATRSPDRPNPLGLHHVTVLAISNTRLKVGPIETINGTPVIDIKPVISVTPPPFLPPT